MSALRQTGSTRQWRRLRLLILDRDGWRCQLPNARGLPCGARASHVDHILPRSQHGSDDPANLRAACSRCNLSRGAGLTGGASLRRPRTGGWSW